MKETLLGEIKLKEKKSVWWAIKLIAGGTDLGNVYNYLKINSKQYGQILRVLNFDLEIRVVIIFFARFSVVNFLTAEILADK